MAKKSSNLFAKLELNYADHPKIAPLSDAAFRLHVEMILYSRKYETDGVIKNRIANRMALRWDTDVLTELASNDKDSPSLVKLANGDYYINGFEDVQETKAEIAARRATNAKNGAKGGRPKKTESVSNSVSDSKTKPATQNKAETETETELTKAKAFVGGETAKTPKKQGQRIPDGWMPPNELIVQMREECPNVDQQFEHRKFVDYWKAKTGKDATKLDWGATYRNWIRRANERAPKSANRATDRMRAGYEAMAGYNPDPINPFEGREIER